MLRRGVIFSGFIFISFLLACQPMINSPKGKVYTIRKTDALLGPDWSQKLVETVPPNTTLTLIGMHQDWYEVQLPDGSYAWVNKQDVKISPYGDAVTTRPTELRQGPDKTFPIVGHVQAGTMVTRLETNGNWVRIMLKNGAIGWIQTSFISER